MDKELELIEHLERSRDGNTYEDGETGVQLTKDDINDIIRVLKIKRSI